MSGLKHVTCSRSGWILFVCLFLFFLRSGIFGYHRTRSQFPDHSYNELQFFIHWICHHVVKFHRSRCWVDKHRVFASKIPWFAFSLTGFVENVTLCPKISEINSSIDTIKEIVLWNLLGAIYSFKRLGKPTSKFSNLWIKIERVHFPQSSLCKPSETRFIWWG